MKEKTKNYYYDDCGRVIMTTDGIIQLIKNGINLNGVLSEINENSIQYNQNSNKSQLTLYTEDMSNETQDQFDLINTKKWLTPNEYQNIDLHTFLINKCSNQEQIDRVKYELELYEERDLIPLLNHLIFLIDHFRKNDIVWGVGRGSSVSSYILFLIGVHKIDAIFYELDIREFLK